VNRVERLIENRDVRVERFDHPSGVRHRDPPREVASGFSINIVDRGRFSIARRGAVHHLNPGDAFLTFPGMEYRTMHAAAEPDDACITLSFRPGYDRDSGERLQRRIMPAAPVVRSGSRIEYLRHRLRIASHAGLAAIEGLAADVVVASFDASQPPAWGRAQFCWYAERVDAARAHIRCHLTDGNRLAELARMVGMSPFHFSRIFRALTGVPPHRYLLEARMQYARALLREGASVTQAAMAAGYDDFSHFSRTFRRCFGHPPSQVRGI
jgi:AraC-like DNA-binding protein